MVPVAGLSATIAGVPALLRYTGSPELGAEADFLQLIDDTAAEVPSIVDDLVARGWARQDRIGIGGRSMGGNVAYASVLADRSVR